MSNPSVSIQRPLAGKQSLAALFRQMFAAYEQAQMARADRVILRFSHLGARIPEDQQKPADLTERAAAAPYRPLIVGISQ